MPFQAVKHLSLDSAASVAADGGQSRGVNFVSTANERGARLLSSYAELWLKFPISHLDLSSGGLEFTYIPNFASTMLLDERAVLVSILDEDSLEIDSDALPFLELSIARAGQWTLRTLGADWSAPFEFTRNQHLTVRLSWAAAGRDLELSVDGNVIISVQRPTFDGRPLTDLLDRPAAAVLIGCGSSKGWDGWCQGTIDEIDVLQQIERPNARSRGGQNLVRPDDWSTAVMFADVMQQSRPWISGTESVWNDGRILPLDSAGNVARLEPGQIARSLLWWADGRQIDYPAGQYNVSWLGTGGLRFRNATVVPGSTTPQSLLLDVAPRGGGVVVEIVSMNSTDPLRALSIKMPEALTVGSFHAPYVDQLRPFKVLRFMEWMRTDQLPYLGAQGLASEADWASMQYPQWPDRIAGRPKPLALLCELAKLIDADPWVNVPHAASDAYVRNMATTLAAFNFRRVYVEHSNEVWNGGYTQRHYADAQGGGNFIGGQQWHGREIVRVGRLFKEVLGSAAFVVAGSFAANPFTTQTILATPDIASVIDAVAVAPYFGGYLGTPAERARVSSMTVDQVLDELRDVEIPRTVRERVVPHIALARAIGKDTVCYESGQSLVQAAPINPAVETLFDAVARHPRMGELYEQYYRAIYDAGVVMANHYNDVQPMWAYGRFGAMETLSDTQSPRYQALLRAFRT